MGWIKRRIANVRVYRAYLTNNRRGKREDVHGRSYRSVYERYGHKIMAEEYLDCNTWCV